MASISEVLGLPEDWSDLQEVKVQKSMMKQDGFAEAMIELIQQVQEKDFGGTTEVSDHERKIIYTGWLMGVEVAQERAKMHMIRMLMKAGVDPKVMFNDDDDE
jgi:exonuclease III